MATPAPSDPVAWSLRMSVDKASRRTTSSILYLSRSTAPFQAKDAATGEIRYKILNSTSQASRHLLVDVRTGTHLAVIDTSLSFSDIYTYQPNASKQKPQPYIKGNQNRDVYFLGKVQSGIGGRIYTIVPPQGRGEPVEVAQITVHKQELEQDDKFSLSARKGGKNIELASATWPAAVEGQPRKVELVVAPCMDLATAVLLYFTDFCLKHRQTAADNARDAAGMAAVACFCEIL